MRQEAVDSLKLNFLTSPLHPFFTFIQMLSIDEINALLKETTLPVVSVPFDYLAGWNSGWHTDCRGQLISVISGVVTVSTEAGVWVIPSQRAAWVPAYQAHKLEIHKNTQIRNLFLDAEMSSKLPEQNAVLQLSPLARELLLEFLSFEQPYDKEGAQGRLVTVLIDQLGALPEDPLHIPFTSEPRLKTILNAFHADPADSTSIQQWSDRLGVSVRTLTRLFDTHLMMSFSKCRQQIRLLIAIKKLAENEPVARVAADVGFQSQSSFTVLFRQVFGVTPKRYFQP